MFKEIKMNKLQKALGIGTFALALGGCGDNQSNPKSNPEPNQYVYGTVVKERGTVAQMINATNVESKNSEKNDKSYVLQIQTDRGLYTATIKEYGFSGNHTLEALALAIEEGSKVKIPLKFLENDQRFAEDKIGWLYANEIFVDTPKLVEKP
jgi:hypothetical protein